jgi:hypothetical protein
MVSVAASSHPSRRERESERETTFRSRAGRSRRSRGHTDMTTVMLESQPTARTMASPPAAVGPDAALLAAPSCSTTHLRPERRPQQPSSGITMSTSSSSLPSTRHTRKGGANHLRSSGTFRQQRVHHPWHRRPRGCQVHARRRNTARRWPATRRWTSGRRSTTVEVGRTVAPPSSATVRGVKTLRVATSRETSTCMHQWVRTKVHMCLSP